MRKLLLPLIFTALAISACGSKSTIDPSAIPTRTPRSTPSASDLELTNTKAPIEVSVGDEFTITVKTFIDPNYHWEVAKELDGSIVEYVWKDHISDDPKNANSNSGKDVWRFKALAPGETTITLGYYQGMADVAAPEVEFTVIVK